MIVHHKRRESDIDTCNVLDDAEFRSEGGEGLCSKIIGHFFKRGHQEVEKTFNQVFFMLLYITICTKLSIFQ